ncbi:MAG: hypothetical protein J6Q53_05540 [Oscillospiraceae bacterium]|nr:hypothetical protein [Oscillospiraceae bacterium]
MREQIDTIPVNEAFLSGDECPFCYLERMAEQKAIRYVLGPGASYMEPDVRGVTDRKGFCGHHFQKMYDYGNALGNALIMQTYYAGLLEELELEARAFQLPDKRPLLGRRKDASDEPILAWAKERQSSCYLCDKLAYNMDRYFTTFFALLKEEEFRARVESGKGFCMRHFVQLMETAHDQLPNAQREWFYPTVIRLMRENMARVKEDIDWFVGMFDYRRAGRGWKSSKDAVSRGMEKLQGLHPADPPYKMDP